MDLLYRESNIVIKVRSDSEKFPFAKRATKPQQYYSVNLRNSCYPEMRRHFRGSRATLTYLRSHDKHVAAHEN